MKNFELLITLFIIASLAMSALIPSLDSLIIYRERGWKRITVKLILTGFFVLIAIGLQLYQYSYNYDKQAEERRKSEMDFKRQDSINKRIAKEELIQNEKRVIETFTKSLAEYGLKYDSSINKIRNIVTDSAYYGLEPNISLCGINGMKLDSGKNGLNHFTLYLCNEVSPAYNIKLNLKFGCQTSTGYHKVEMENMEKFSFPTNYSVGIGERASVMSIYLPSNDVKGYILSLTISCTNLQGTKNFKRREIVYFYRLADGALLMPTGDYEKRLLKILNNK